MFYAQSTVTFISGREQGGVAEEFRGGEEEEAEEEAEEKGGGGRKKEGRKTPSLP